MSDSVLNDLKMAEISLAKVKDVGQLQQEARGVLGDFRTNLRVKEEVQNALINLESKADYQINQNDARQIDEIVTNNSDLIVKFGGLTLSGTESFGVDITPAEWRATRSVALRQILGETYKNIKRWANQLADNFHRRWVELITSTEVLENRLEAVDSILDVVGRVREGCTGVELNELIVRSISKNGRMLSGDLGKALQGELNYITSCLRSWELEQVRFKNTIIRYFGNEKNKNMASEIYRDIPKLFNQRSKIDDNSEGMLIAKQTLPLLDGFVFQGVTIEDRWISSNIKTVEDNSLYADSLSLTGYYVVKDVNIKSSKQVVPVLTLAQIFAIRDIVKTIIDKLKVMNVESDPVNFNPDDVKDVLNTLREAGDDNRAYQYGLITADYQFNVNDFKTHVSGNLTVLASHLITMINQHLECYDVE